MTWIDLLGHLGALVIIATYSMKTMIPLRVAGIAGSCIFITYGYLSSTWPVLMLHLVVLPLNSVRLYQMLQLVKKVSASAQGELSMDWLKPFMASRRCAAGETLFRAGDVADSMYYVVEGGFRLVEIDAQVPPGQVVGDVAFVAPDQRRTLSLECQQAGEVLTISYDQVRQLYFQNPTFGFYFLRLISQRLFADIERLRRSQAPAAGPGGA
ncbi:MAG: Crp/Fnr family transcriptional regulator [Rubrivivax sp.]